MKDLGTRVGVAAIGIPAVLGLAYLGGWYLALPLTAFAAWGTHEVARLSAKKDVHALEFISAPAAAALVLAAAWSPTFRTFAPIGLGVIGAATVAALATALSARGPAKNPLGASAVTGFSVVYLGLPLGCAMLLRALPESPAWSVPPERSSASGLALLALPLAATWIGDAAAYFAGSTWGRAKMAPSISPNKSWVGFWANVAGGGVAAVLWALAVAALLPDLPMMPMPLVGVLGAGLGATAVVGDLVESLLKREAGVKDSGTFFPGHGGVLDRIDSLLFTIPAAYVALAVLGATG
ncbi:MAG: phosphatidate cytidylyltransferase [Gemmatimonadota bacterium]|nr:phosphatidate cytidylyltransferase [Gemmatimonadota bacterium]